MVRLKPDTPRDESARLAGMQVPSATFDAIVVGSGISGGWAAKELTERGLRVLLLERGRNVEHIKDYGNALKSPWEYAHRGGRTLAMEEAYPVLRRDYPLNEKNLDWWASDQDSPYTEVRRFDWYRGYHVGGRSLLWGRQSYRLGDLDFEANAREGIAVDWPIRYADLAPWYDHVERFAGISGSREGLAQLPDGQFQPAMPLNCVEEAIAARLTSQFGGRRRIIPGRVANLTERLPGRGACQYRNACWLGCPFGAYFSTQSSTLPAAMATKRLTLRTFAIVTGLVYDRDRRRAKSVRVLDAVSGQVTEYSAPVIFLCASSLNSTWVLMRSATDVWPGGLGSSSGELGHNLMDHHFRCGANGEVEGHEGSYVYGRRPTGFYIPRFRNLPGDERREYVRGFGYQGSASRQGWERAVAELGVGSAFKDAMSTPGPWRLGATAFGEMLPNHANRVWIDARTDKWGLPVLAIDCATGENERLMRRDMMNDMAEMLEAAGVRDVKVFDNDYAPGMGIHEMGTARMGRDPKTSVLNAHNQVWDCPNVFVTDGACMTSSACQNPSLTYMALTARAAAYAVEELKRGNL
jgi:choline dehydrogenase-like flavoprotein